MPPDSLLCGAPGEDFQGVELLGMRRLCFCGFLEASLLLSDETTIPNITHYLLADEDRMLFFEAQILCSSSERSVKWSTCQVVYAEGLQTLASRRKAGRLQAVLKSLRPLC